MKVPRSLTHGGKRAGSISFSDWPRTASSSTSTLLSAMFTSLRQAVFCRGWLQTVPFHPLSCQGTRMDT